MNSFLSHFDGIGIRVYIQKLCSLLLTVFCEVAVYYHAVLNAESVLRENLSVYLESEIAVGVVILAGNKAYMLSLVFFYEMFYGIPLQHRLL